MLWISLKHVSPSWMSALTAKMWCMAQVWRQGWRTTHTGTRWSVTNRGINCIVGRSPGSRRAHCRSHSQERRTEVKEQNKGKGGSRERYTAKKWNSLTWSATVHFASSNPLDRSSQPCPCTLSSGSSWIPDYNQVKTSLTSSQGEVLLHYLWIA